MKVCVANLLRGCAVGMKLRGSDFLRCSAVGVEICVSDFLRSGPVRVKVGIADALRRPSGGIKCRVADALRGRGSAYFGGRQWTRHKNSRRLLRWNTDVLGRTAQTPFSAEE